MTMPWVKVFADDWQIETQDLSDAEKGRLMDAIVALLHGVVPEGLLKGNERFIFRHFERSVQVQMAEYQRNIENGKKGGRPPKKPTETHENPTEPTKRQNRRTEEQKIRRTEDKKNRRTEEYTLPYNPLSGLDAERIEKLKRLEAERNAGESEEEQE